MQLVHFHPDRSISLDLDDGTVTLRPPNIGEWRLLFGLWEDADTELQMIPEAERASGLWGGANPYAEALAETIALLSSTAKPDPDKLPLWTGVPGLFARLYMHWRVVEFDYVEAADPLAPKPVDPQPVDEPVDHGQARGDREAAEAEIVPVDLDELRATTPVPVTGGIGQHGEVNMG